VADQRLAGRLVGPIVDLNGAIVGFWARHPQGSPPSYLYWRGGWRDDVPAFGLQAALAAAKARALSLVLVEDILDALLLWSHGLENVAALGDSVRRLDGPRWQRLAAGADRVVLAVGGDQTAGARLRRALEAAFSAEAAPSIRVVPPEQLALSAPGELVRCRGAEHLRSLLEREPIPAYTFKALDLLRTHQPRRGWTNAARRKAMNEAVGFYAWQSTRRGETAELDAHFVPPIVAALGWKWGATGPPAQPRATATGWCELHGCEATDCFCFD